MFQAHYVKKRGREIGKHAAFAQLCAFQFVADENYGHGVGGVLRERRFAVIRNHLVGVAVVGGNKRRAAHFENFIHNFFHAFVHNVHGFHRRAHHARMPYHVAVGEV